MMNKRISLLQKTALILPLVISVEANADGTVIDKIYHPYVDALEQEIEYRSIFQNARSGGVSPAQLHKISFGMSLNEKMFGEVYLIAEKDRMGSFDVEAYEIEFKWQLTEQGEYAVDWGILLEYENEFSQDIQEFAVGILAEKEWGRISGSANVFVTNEWGDDIHDEVESSLALQLRYRYSRLFEPALELYKGQDSFGLGPAVRGNINVGTRKSLTWEAGLVLGLDSTSPNHTARVLLEYEF